MSDEGLTRFGRSRYPHLLISLGITSPGTASMVSPGTSREVDTVATRDERAALLASRCDWCGAAPGEECHVVGSNRPVLSLDGGCHDARWRAALGRPAPVLTLADTA